MEQLIKRTHILKNLENKNSKMSVVKLSKNSHFFVDCSLFDLDLKNRYTLAVISLNMPIIFKEVADLSFRITLPIDTKIDELVFIIFKRDFTISLHSECQQFLLYSHLDTIKNKLKSETEKKPDFLKTETFVTADAAYTADAQEILEEITEPSAQKTEEEPIQEKSEFLKDILKKDLTENFDFLGENLTNFENTAAAPKDEYEKALQKDYITDPLLKEDSTLGDNLEIAEFNYFDEKQIPNELKEEKISEQNPASDNVKKYYQSIKSELDELFKAYEREYDLEKLIADCRFCKITYEKNKYYIVGVIFENGSPEYICYGVPSNNPVESPKELKGFSSFVPVLKEDNFGYWIMYQDADTGETILP
ncbi:MAG: hypothetical protein FWG51_00025 [Firmicutes bacterium]|nr:hypothetical protein [Bacillota bacterium]